MVTSAGKAVDLYATLLWGYQSDGRTKPHVHNILSTQQNIVNSNKCIDYTSKVSEKQFLDVRKRCHPESPRIKFCCSWFAGPTRLLYFVALILHARSATWNSTQLQMPRRQGVKS